MRIILVAVVLLVLGASPIAATIGAEGEPSSGWGESRQASFKDRVHSALHPLEEGDQPLNKAVQMLCPKLPELIEVIDRATELGRTRRVVVGGHLDHHQSLSEDRDLVNESTRFLARYMRRHPRMVVGVGWDTPAELRPLALVSINVGDPELDRVRKLLYTMDAQDQTRQTIHLEEMLEQLHVRLALAQMKLELQRRGQRQGFLPLPQQFQHHLPRAALNLRVKAFYLANADAYAFLPKPGEPGLWFSGGTSATIRVSNAGTYLRPRHRLSNAQFAVVYTYPRTLAYTGYWY